MIDFKIEPISDSITLVKVGGSLNEMTQSYFFDCIADYLDSEDAQHVIIECRELGFVSSAGMAAMLKARKKTQKHGSKIYFTHLNSTISSALKYTKLNTLLAIYPSTKELLGKLHQDAIAIC